VTGRGVHSKMHKRILNPIRLFPRLPSPRLYSSSNDPLAHLTPHLKTLRTTLLPLLTSGNPTLSELTKYYFLHPSKHIRPVIVLLFSQATNGLGRSWPRKLLESKDMDLDRPLTRPDVLNDWNPAMEGSTREFEDVFLLTPPTPHYPPSHSQKSPPPSPTPSRDHHHHLLPTQLRLAQIVEMLHTASLLHDDVIDASPLRRGAPSAPSKFGSKLSVLGGNFVLGRASTALAKLGDGEVTQLIASVISNLVDGEILQMRDVVLGGGDVGMEEEGTTQDIGIQGKTKNAWTIYLQKTYLKTASLMAKGARSAVVLGGCEEGEVWKDIAYAYGRNLGIAFQVGLLDFVLFLPFLLPLPNCSSSQLIDDILDYESTSTPGSADLTLGKPGGADLQLGLATGPALYAWEEFPEMGELIGRKFEGPGDVEMVCFVSPFIFLFLVFPSTSSLRLLPQIAFFPLTPPPTLFHVTPPLLYFDSVQS
jgi:hexaprenyl-diphosphate synthase